MKDAAPLAWAWLDRRCERFFADVVLDSGRWKAFYDASFSSSSRMKRW